MNMLHIIDILLNVAPDTIITCPNTVIVATASERTVSLIFQPYEF